MDTQLLKILEKEVEKEKAKKKNKPIFKVRKEKSVMYYSGWAKENQLRKKRQENKLNFNCLEVL